MGRLMVIIREASSRRSHGGLGKGLMSRVSQEMILSVGPNQGVHTPWPMYYSTHSTYSDTLPTGTTLTCFRSSLSETGGGVVGLASSSKGGAGPLGFASSSS